MSENLSLSTYKKTRLGLIPNDWFVKKGEDITEKITKGASPKWQGFDYQQEGVLFVTSENVRDGYLDINKPKYLSTGFSEKQKNSKLKYGDLLINIVGASIGRSCQFDQHVEANINQAVCLFRTKSVADSSFVKYFLQLEKVQNRLLGTQTESARPNLSLTDIRNFEFIIPEKEAEKEKIAQILSTWDNAIKLTEKLSSIKEEQKKGLMQKLLTGEVRLPGFKEEWRSVKLSQIGKTYNGLTGKQAEDFGSGKPYIPYKTIYSDSKIDISKLEHVSIGNDEKQNSAKFGDVFFTTSSETPDEVGMSSVLLDDVDEVYLNSFCFGYRLNNFNVLLPEFARHYFRSDEFRRKTFSLAQGSTRFNISKNEVMKIEILIPFVEEQEAIATILSNSDKEIKLLEEHRNTLKEQKKGLMQLLLTGKIRVKV